MLLDLLMPGMSGFEVLSKLRTNEKTKDIPIIIITAKVDKETQEKALSMGADEFIKKPVNMIELKEVIKKN